MNTCVVLILFVFGLCKIVSVTEGTEHQVFTEDEPRKKSGHRERVEKMQQEYNEKQRGRDSDWLNRYKAVFNEGIELGDIDGMVELFEDLYRRNPSNSDSPIVTQLGADVLDLIRLSSKFYAKCDNTGFERFDKLLEKYAKGFSNSLLDYIQLHRSRFWQKCKQAFLDCQQPDKGIYKDDETEAFSLARFTSCALNAEEQKSLSLGLKSVNTGVVYYIDYKLGKKAYKKNKIKVLFDVTILPVCRSVQSRFVGNDQMGEIIKNREDLKANLDAKSSNWLTAIKVCEFIAENSDLIEQNACSIQKFWHEEGKRDHISSLEGCFTVRF